MLSAIFLGIFCLGIGTIFLILYLYKDEVLEVLRGESIAEDEPIRALGVKGTIMGENVVVDKSARLRLLQTSSESIKANLHSAKREPVIRSGVVNINTVRESIELLNQYLSDCMERLQYFDGSTVEPSAIASKATADNIILTRKLVQVLKKRVEILKEERRSNSPDYQKIYEEITAPVVFVKDTLHSLLSSQDTPPIKWDDLNLVVKKLTSDLDEAIRDKKRIAR